MCRAYTSSWRRTTIVACTGTAANSTLIDTTPGEHEFTVTARDSLGLPATQAVHYRVADLTRPRIRRLRIVPRTIDATDPRAYALVGFKLSEQARVRVAVHRAGSGKGRAARARARVITGHEGFNSFRLRAHFGRRTLPPGAYRLTLVATDRSGNRSRAVERRFVVTS